MPDTLAGGKSVGNLVVELEIGFGAVRELMTYEESSAPALGQRMIAEVVANFAVEADGADAGVDLDGEKEVGPGATTPRGTERVGLSR